MRADLNEFFSEVENPFDFVVVLKEIRNGYLKECDLVGDDVEVIMTAAVGKIGGVISGRELLFSFDSIYKQFFDILWDTLILSPDLYEFPEIFLVVATTQKVHVQFQILLDLYFSMMLEIFSEFL